VAAQIDGDGQRDPQYLAAALRPIVAGAADFVIGSRYLGGTGFQSTALRRAGTRYLSWFLRLRCGVRVTDPTSGFRVANRSRRLAQECALLRAELEELRSHSQSPLVTGKG